MSKDAIFSSPQETRRLSPLEPPSFIRLPAKPLVCQIRLHSRRYVASGACAVRIDKHVEQPQHELLPLHQIRGKSGLFLKALLHGLDFAGSIWTSIPWAGAA
jgi:hypothetical protein